MTTIAEIAMNRKSSRITQRDVTTRLGWNQETLTDIELGRITVSAETLNQIAQTIEGIATERQETERQVQGEVMA